MPNICHGVLLPFTHYLDPPVKVAGRMTRRSTFAGSPSSAINVALKAS